MQMPLCDMGATFFISDTHFGLQSQEDEDLKLEKLETLFAIIKAEGGSLYMLGDILDYWMEFHHVIPKGFTRFICLLSDLVRSHADVYYLAGNHDFFLGRFFDEELGVKTLYGVNSFTRDGKQFIVAHGDGLGEGDIGYKLFARFVRNRYFLGLFTGFHADLGVALMRKSSRFSRHHKQVNYTMEKDRLLNFAQSLVTKQEFDYFVCGHNHVRGEYLLSNGSSRYINLGSWIDGINSYGVFRDGALSLQEL
ncbi:UDP-2,3-diacylglucosamine diphosphatase [Chlorobium phaeobacteroides]|jgi:UDP-2,3-diacylglucosamine hydrolase|uniref:Metallophosphoesterase n=1 Tax=Chlorobium phaeobacteroides (strain DSM 266 / SMG 266 / 2430) TaxID=290317 RepID=A1BIW9_CHLPD|nr:UDP-2,3-diacylglucosamine diphosphatase [Chlorobium phaeobacteroides]ABL66346.1 metallophosphoesterase [Chlorobium phaeobacteroides DSM 266]